MAIHEDLAAKRLEVFKEVVPGLSRVAVLTNPSDTFGARRILDETRAAAEKLNIVVQPLEAQRRSELEPVITAVGQTVQGIILQPNGLFHIERAQIAELAIKLGIPTMGFNALTVNSGFLVSYAPSIPGLFQRSAVYIDKIVKGAKPSDLPVELPTKFELFVNLKTAKTLRLNISDSLLVRADRIIE